MSKISFVFFILFSALTITSNAQLDQSKTGAWYMYFWNTTFGDSPWGVQGDFQFRNWNAIGDLEQLLLRGGVTYKPKGANIKFTLGYGNVQTGAYGEDNSTVSESRIYQEALFPQDLGNRFHLIHRFRYEQRFVEGQDFRTRFRYNFFINIGLNKAAIEDKTIYLALYNELFINGERPIGDGREVELFDRNRTYAAIGYAIKKQLRVQLGAMRQITDNWGKTQAQLSLHHKF